MDKLFNNHWFLKIISFFIACMLFVMVNIDQFKTNQPQGVFPPRTNTSYTLEDVELKAYYDEEQFVIVDMPATVQVNLNGPQGAITLLQLTKPNYEVYVDLQNKGAGAHYVTVQHKGFPKELSVSIVPSFVRVELQEKKTVSIPVQVDIINADKIAEGYSLSDPIVTPINVEVTGAQDYINQLAAAKVFLDVAGADRTVEESAPVKLYDYAGNEILYLTAEPSVVDVRVPITSPNKIVPIKITRKGDLPDDLSIRSLTLEPREVTIYGPKKVIDQITVIENVILDQSEITGNQIVTLKVPRPPGVEKVEPETIKVKVEVSKKVSKKMEGIFVEVSGLAEGFSYQLLNLDSHKIDVVLYGAKDIIEKTTIEEIQAIIDVSELTVGEHEVPIQVIGPQFLTFEPSLPAAKIKIFAQ